MFDRWFSLLFDLCSGRRRLMLGLAAILTAAAAVGAGSLSLANDLELMLPGDDQIRRSMRFLRESHFSDDVVVSLERRSSDASLEDLIRAADQLERSLEPPLVTEVVSGVSGGDLFEDLLSLVKHLPELVDEPALSRIDARISPDGVEESLRANYRKLVSPSSAFMAPFVRSDPLGISSELLGSLRELSSSLGYEVEIEDGHFVSRDHAHTMLVLRTPVTVTEVSRARELVAYLHRSLGELPDFVSADIIGGHLHSISNEDVMRRDVRVALSISGAAFMLLFLFVFRDLRAALLFFFPVASIVVSINLSNLILEHLSYFIVGMGGVIAGISVDYGIHVYVAVRSAGGRADAVKQVAKPVVTAALTTMAVFAAFFFSRVEGYRQLALFSILSIALSLGCALFLLPQLVGGSRGIAVARAPRSDGAGRGRGRGGVAIAGWAVVMAAGVVSMAGLRFDSDIRKFDGSEPYVIEAEEKFHRVWGGRDRPAVLVVPGQSLDEALRRSRLVYRDAVAVMGEEGFASLSAVWLPEQERAENRARWKEFWRQGREAELRRLLREHASAYGFSKDAFSPFLDDLHAEGGGEDGLESLGIFSRLKERFVQERQDGVQVLSFFPDEDEWVSEMSEISERHPGTFLVSRKVLSRALSQSISSEILYLSGVAALLVPVLAGLCLGSVRLTALALVPVATGVVALLGMISALGLSLDAPSVISAIVAVGLTIDYGVFMVSACHHRLETGTRMAVTLSAVTTLIGAGALLFARHPILFAIGSTMTTGVLAGYVSSLLVVPPLYRSLVGKGAGAR